jgi:electron transport complex protein RnfC
MGLQPYLISAYADLSRFDDAGKYRALDCMECGCCSYNCPANRHIVQSIRLAKSEILNARKKSG